MELVNRVSAFQNSPIFSDVIVEKKQRKRIETGESIKTVRINSAIRFRLCRENNHVE